MWFATATACILVSDGGVESDEFSFLRTNTGEAVQIEHCLILRPMSEIGASCEMKVVRRKPDFTKLVFLEFIAALHRDQL